MHRVPSKGPRTAIHGAKEHGGKDPLRGGGAISPEQFIAALTDFSERRPESWPNLDTKFYRLHELGDTWAEVTEGTDVFGGIWAREHYDWS